MPGPFKHKLFSHNVAMSTNRVASDFRDMAQMFQLQAPKDGNWKVYMVKDRIVALNMDDMDQSLRWTELGWQPINSKELHT